MTLRVELPDLPGWSALSRGDLHVVVRAGGAVVERLTASLEDGDVDEVLDALARDGLRRAPDFVVVLASEPVRVVARGTAYAVLTTATGQHEVRAPARGPWADEDGPHDVGTVELRTGDEGPVAVGEPSRSAQAETPTAVVAPAPSQEPAPPVPPRPPAAPAADATTPPPPDPDRAGGGQGWRRPALFGRQGEVGSAPPTPVTAPPTSFEPPAPTAAPAASPVASDPLVSRAPTPEPPAPQPAAAGTPAADEADELPSYDHLFGATQHDRPSYIEQHDTGTIEEPPLGHAPIESIGGYDPSAGDSAAEGHVAPRARAAALPSVPTPAAHSEALPVQAPSPAPRQGALIDSVPWRSGGSNVPPAPVASMPAPVASMPAPVAAAPTPVAAAPAPVASMPVASMPATPVTPPPAAPAPPAHAAAVGASPGPIDAEATVDRSALLGRGAPEAGPQVLAVLCPAGHSSPPHSGACRQCGREIPPQQPFQTARPPLGVLQLPTGDVVVLDRGVLLGRSPRVNAELDAAARPHLVRVSSAQNDISRNHVEIVLEGWHVLIRDLGSTNGTTVALPGEAPLRLRPSDQQVLEPGAVITLADEVAITFEVQA